MEYTYEGTQSMTASGYTEDALVERPAIALLAALGWEVYQAYWQRLCGITWIISTILDLAP
jgi:hypothetical protein